MTDRRTTLHTLPTALAVVTILILLIFSLLEPRWQTNDDVAMSMVAHGYGIADFGSPKIVFSNIIWGYLVNALPEIQGVLGYSLATLATIWLAGTAILHGLIRCGVGFFISCGVLILILARPILFPQFTINAGLLMVGAVICAHLYNRHRSIWALGLGCTLAFVSFIIRIPEFILILLIALPLLPWQSLWEFRAPKIAAALLLAALTFSVTLDHFAYHTAEWEPFNDLNRVRAPITDFGADRALKQRPDILKRYGYSTNDIDLMAKFFLVDEKIIDPGKLKAMLSELESRRVWDSSFEKAWLGITELFHPTLLPIIFTALFLAFLYPSWKIAAVWGLSVTALFAIGFYGRPGILHVYIPVASLLTIAPLLILSPGTSRPRLSALIIIAAIGFNIISLTQDSVRSQARSHEIRASLADFPTSTVVVWGATFPFESIYPVFRAWQPALQFRLHGLGAFTLAPFSVATAERRAGRGVTDLLTTDAGLPIIGDELRLKLLNIYCVERFGGEMREILSREYGVVHLGWQRCVPTL